MATFWVNEVGSAQTVALLAQKPFVARKQLPCSPKSRSKRPNHRRVRPKTIRIRPNHGTGLIRKCNGKFRTSTFYT